MRAAQETENSSFGLFRSTSVVSFMTLLSRISGLARDVVISRMFGAGLVTDAFFLAFKIPNLLRRFFAEGAFSHAFVPVISEYRSRRAPVETRELIEKVSGTLGLALFVITALGVAIAPVLIMIFAPGFLGDDGRYELGRDMLRLTFPYIFFISMTALAGGILNAHGRFAAPAATPVLLNLVLIAFTLWVAPHLERPGMGLALGVFVAGVVQLAFQAPFLLALGLLPRPRWGWAHEGVRRIGRLMLPAVFGTSVAQINILFDTVIASFLVAASITWLYYAERLVEFPLGVFGIALATVILPNLSEQHARASREDFSAMLDWALKLVLLIALPAALGLALLAEPLVASIFHGGQFLDEDVGMVAVGLVAYAPGLIGFILVKVLAPGYFARQDTRTPVRVGVQAMLLNMVLNVILVVTLVRTDWLAPHAGLAAATSISALFNAAMLLRGLRNDGVYRPGDGWRKLVLRIVLASLAMTVFVLWVRGEPEAWLVMSLWERVAALTFSVTGAVAIYFGTCYLLGMRPGELRMRPGAR
jgi:putative peptidoglycan lipid II flippase